MKNDLSRAGLLTFKTALEQGLSALGNYLLLFSTIAFLNIGTIPKAGLYTSANLIVIAVARSTLSSVLISEITNKSEYPKFLHNLKWYLPLISGLTLLLAIFKVLDFINIVFLFSFLLVPIGEILRTVWLASRQLNRLLGVNIVLILFAIVATFIIKSQENQNFTSLLAIWVILNITQVVIFLFYFLIDWHSAKGKIFLNGFSSIGLTLGFIGGLVPHIANIIITIIMNILGNDLVRGQQLLISTFFLPIGFFINFQFNRVLTTSGESYALKAIWGKNLVFSALLLICTLVFLVFNQDALNSLSLFGALVITISTVIVSYLSIKLQISLLAEKQHRATFSVKLLWLFVVTISSFLFGINGSLLVFTIGLFLSEVVTLVVSYKLSKRDAKNRT
jgi:hypothetical protein